MFLLLALLGCPSPAELPAIDAVPTRPAMVPANALSLHLTQQGVQLEGTAVGDLASLEANLTNGMYPPLIEALPNDSRAVWIDAPEDAPWMAVRRLVISASEAGHAERWLSLGTTSYPMASAPKSRFQPRCPDGAQAASAIARRMNIAVHSSSDGVWAQANVRFYPVLDGATRVGIPDECWTGDCDLSNQSAACQVATESPKRVTVGGPNGCLLPIRKAPGDEKRWAEELASALQGLGWTDTDEVSLQIEANVPWSSVMALLDGFGQAGLPQPSIGMPLVEGHEAPPPCNADVSTASQLDEAQALWLGAQVYRDSAP